jgi:hypothetical protein
VRKGARLAGVERSERVTSEVAGANLRRQEGNNPDRRLRSPNPR